MPIDRNAAPNGGFIDSPGEYRVKIHHMVTGTSKSGKPMLTVEFHTDDDRAIRAYFVKELGFHMKSLALLKAACGLKETDGAEKLAGRECGILVEAQAPDQNTGRIFMSIVGYGPANEARPTEASDFAPSDEAVPF